MGLQQSTSPSVDFQGTIIVSTGISETDRIQRWIYEPIEELKGHRGFTILLLIIPIYERYLRYTYNHEGSFSINSRPISGIMSDLDVSRDQANQFWQIMRNGLLHRSAPKQTASYKKYVLVSSGKPIIEPSVGQLVINPYAIRPILLNIFRKNPAFWSQSDYPIPDEVTVAYQPPKPAEQLIQTQPHIP